MYLLVILFLMLVFPVVCILVDAFAFASHADLVTLVGRWFVFWAVGVRLFVAGLRQVFQPRFTAETIFEIKDSKSLVFVQELGFANIAIGVLGIISIVSESWILPAAIVGFLFFGMAGIRHIANKRNRTENITLVSNLGIAVVMAVVAVGEALGR